jgi:hypothetical protein
MNPLQESRIEPLTVDLIRRSVESEQLTWIEEDDGTIVIENELIYPLVGLQRKLEIQMYTYVARRGEYGELLSISCYTDKPIARAQWGRAILACNTWNSTRRWPVAYVDVSEVDLGQDLTTDLVLDYYLDMSRGASLGLIAETTGDVIARACEFWEWVIPKHGLLSQ